MSRAEAGSTQKAIPASAGIITKELIARINEIRPGLITGCYLTGSIAQNDFHPDKSDIDFVMLCNSFPDAGLQQQIRQIHKSIRKDFKWPDLNGCYITADSLNVHRARATQTLSFQEGQLTVSAFDMAPITLYELKTAAITIHGLPAENLPIVIEEKDVHDFLLGNINSYWTAWVRKYASIRQCKFLLILIPRLTEWGAIRRCQAAIYAQNRADYFEDSGRLLLPGTTACGISFYNAAGYRHTERRSQAPAQLATIILCATLCKARR